MRMSRLPTAVLTVIGVVLVAGCGGPIIPVVIATLQPQIVNAEYQRALAIFSAHSGDTLLTATLGLYLGFSGNMTPATSLLCLPRPNADHPEQHLARRSVNNHNHGTGTSAPWPPAGIFCCSNFPQFTSCDQSQATQCGYIAEQIACGNPCANPWPESIEISTITISPGVNGGVGRP